jgi:uncharacterized protein (TIGR02679 family)
MAKRLANDEPQRCRILVDEAAYTLETLDCAENDETASETHKNWSLAELAARFFGDSHALEAHHARTRFLRLVTGRREEQAAEFWQDMGVSCLTTSSSVLLLNIRFSAGRCAKAVNAYAEVGEPFRLTLRALRDHPEAGRMTEVSVCENPAVLEAAADRWGPVCRPLVCTEGQPSVACRNLLRRLEEAGASLRYHGDFDWGGLRIANGLFREFSALAPWRYDSSEYMRITTGYRGGFTLSGHPVEAAWDPLLRSRMEQEGRGHHEESVLDDLLNDLAP